MIQLLEHKKPGEIRRLESEASRICSFLAPFFHMPSKAPEEVFSKVILTELDHPFASSDPRKLFLRTGEKDFAIAHEVGHCIHWAINPQLPNFLNKNICLLQENVANYAEIIYFTKNLPDFKIRLTPPLVSRVGYRYLGYDREGKYLGHELTNGISYEELESLQNLLNNRRREMGLI